MYDLSILDDESKWTVNNAHDPAIIKTDQGYYVYSTDVRVAGEPKPGVMVRKSDDLINWKWVGQALPGIPKEALDWTGATNLWAPDIIKAGIRTDCIIRLRALAARSLPSGCKPPSPEGPWKDEGLVVKTAGQEKDGLNAIDANPVLDALGNPWMVYGSFFDGFTLRRLTRIRGSLRKRDTVRASRQGIVQPKRERSRGHISCIIQSFKNIIYLSRMIPFSKTTMCV